MKTSKSGISLIVLVITIIVMVILATAIILSISGSDIRGKAEEAASSNDIATAKEIVSVARSEWEADYYELTEEYEDFKEYANEKLEKSGITNMVASNTGAVNIIYTDKNEDTAIIPEGFSVSTVSSEQTIDDGLVIVDKDGNEFVWVPVDNYARFERTTTYKPTEEITTPSSSFTEPYSYDLAITEANDLTREYAEYDKMRESVKENKGFYIARYEAGLPEGKTTSTVTIADKPISKKVATVWNNIPWGTSMTEIGTEGAVYRARQMYKGSKSVVSTLCYGVQWDAALQFIATNEEHKDYPTNSDVKGYYAYDENMELIEGMESAVQPTGYYAVNNIYDMAGNVNELTMEAVSTSYRFVRGGDYSSPGGTVTPASSRNSCPPDVADVCLGFRITLYIK